MKTAIVTGVSGMDGSVLSEKLIKKGYRVVGVDRWNPTGVNPNLKWLTRKDNFILETGDITERFFIENLFRKYEPDYFYNLAAISLVPESFKIPHKFFEINTMAVINMLECVRHISPKTRFYQASSSEQIGKNTDYPQNTDSKMIPNSPYAVAKLASFHMVRLYRDAYGLFCVNGMLWNHEGTRRGPTFVTRKITLGVANIVKERQEYLALGNLNAKRDWGMSEDYCDAMILMMESDKPDDYPVATSEMHSIREFVEEAFKVAEKTITWQGEGLDEVGIDEEGVVRVRVDKKFYRPGEVPLLFGDYTKTKNILGWEPKTKFKKLVKIMVEHDLELSNEELDIVSTTGGLSK